MTLLFNSIMWRMSFNGMLLKVPPFPIPTLLTRILTPKLFSRTHSKTFSMAPSSMRSIARQWLSTCFVSRMSSHTDCRQSRSFDTSRTFILRDAHSYARARPIPLQAPVIRAYFRGTGSTVFIIQETWLFTGKANQRQTYGKLYYRFWLSFAASKYISDAVPSMVGSFVT